MLGNNDNFFIVVIQNSLVEERKILQTENLTMKVRELQLGRKSQRMITVEDSGSEDNRYL